MVVGSQQLEASRENLTKICFADWSSKYGNGKCHCLSLINRQSYGRKAVVIASEWLEEMPRMTDVYIDLGNLLADLPPKASHAANDEQG